MHGWYSYLADHPGGNPHEPDFHAMSHGESFVALLQHRFDTAGFYCLDEPEAAWEDLEVVHHWRTFLDRPDRFLRHLLD
ncbi:hypothetical protein [Aeromicrobium duanguangcaii]|uniref:Uncharacterized protein n=2 Tax=Aeromicrobium duanguangcaii TaxID=2968086 RepID=A0ABY5KE33_9ACTN|nr:hypothetical protein [Aeromicrobium duanguangcaii]MCD9154900.1 hypothetical protein [Aeromicrobium duanguangcaii]UUI67691.1 hypothetical protein NP095_10830 [Aeromicrobium duanguangcaii]